jgi:DDE superfamily endonuclease
MILDNYATHKHPDVKAWLNTHPRFHLHFTPTSSSWLNLVERWFRELTDKALRRGVFYSVPDLIAKIEAYLSATNHNPKPFVWTATTESILAKIARGRVALERSINSDRRLVRSRCLYRHSRRLPTPPRQQRHPRRKRLQRSQSTRMDNRSTAIGRYRTKQASRR